MFTEYFVVEKLNELCKHIGTNYPIPFTYVVVVHFFIVHRLSRMSQSGCKN